MANLLVCAFRGIKELNVIHDDLEHGAELNYEEKVGLSRLEIERMITPRERLTVFRQNGHFEETKLHCEGYRRRTRKAISGIKQFHQRRNLTNDETGRLIDVGFGI